MQGGLGSYWKAYIHWNSKFRLLKSIKWFCLVHIKCWTVDIEYELSWYATHHYALAFSNFFLFLIRKHGETCKEVDVGIRNSLEEFRKDNPEVVLSQWGEFNYVSLTLRMANNKKVLIKM